MGNLTVVYGGKTQQDAAKSIEAYLGFGAAIVAEGFNGRLGRYGAVISVPDEHLQWQAGRLQSGLIATREVDSAKAGAEHLRDLFNVEVQQRSIEVRVQITVKVDLRDWELAYGEPIDADDVQEYTRSLVRESAEERFKAVGWGTVI